MLNQYKKINAKKSKDCINSFITIFELLCVYKIQARITKGNEIIRINDIYSH